MGEVIYPESELLPLSALQHLVFCPRQCALIHLEQAWEENALTAEGRILHEKTDSAKAEWRGGVRIARSLRIRSLRLGLAGVADVVEFHPAETDSDNPDDTAEAGVTLPGMRGRWRPFPVEYKRGKAKKDDSDRAQLCAQALCLEEMLGVAVPAGALFYGETRRRLDVAFDARLRGRTEALAQELHTLMAARVTPQAEYEAKCDRCSLIEICMPKLPGSSGRVDRFVAKAIAAAIGERLP